MTVRYAKILTRAQLGLSTHLITIEIHISAGLPGLSMVGLPETAIKESRDRVRSAILNAGFEFPKRRITINLAPADLPKREGGRFDLPIALGVLIATQQIHWPHLVDYEFAGELGLDGYLHRFNGAAVMALAVKQAKRILVVPTENVTEIQLITDLHYVAASSLAELCNQINDLFEHDTQNAAVDASSNTVNSDTKVVIPGKLSVNSVMPPSSSKTAIDLSSLVRITPKQPAIDIRNSYEHELNLEDIYGQQEAKRALEIAAAGGHSLFIMGPPGVGKSMLAHRLITILPPLTYSEALENVMIYSLYHGYDNAGNLLQTVKRPFRAPHHSISTAALIGGSNPPVPGEISLANHGVLFLDELLEFSRKTLEALREPLENHQVIISRAAHCAIFPCNFQLVVAMNPCPCGHYGDKFHTCSCSHEQLRSYRSRISGPLLDRMDLWLWMPSLGSDLALIHQRHFVTDNYADNTGYKSELVRQRVIAARERAMTRANKLNSALNNHELKRDLRLSTAAKNYLQKTLERGSITVRSYHRILKVSRTIADLAAIEEVQVEHLQEALSYRRKLNQS